MESRDCLAQHVLRRRRRRAAASMRPPDEEMLGKIGRVIDNGGMQTALADFVKNTAQGRTADAILRACVHCGFCNAACPTYQLLGDELDGPRGRIYLIKQVLEGRPATARTRLHLDRCLTCRACETICPSGVRYGELLDIGRELVERQTVRPFWDRLRRALLGRIIPHPARFTPLLRLGQALRLLLPATLKRRIPAYVKKTPWPSGASKTQPPRSMLLLDGCVQPSLAPNINAATARTLRRLGIHLQVAPASGCCGALSHHLPAPADATAFMRRNIDAWWPYVEAGAEAIVTTASGCGVMVKDYGRLLADDPQYAVKAMEIARRTKDIGEVLTAEETNRLRSRTHGRIKPGATTRKIAFHAPCTLQHGQKLNGVVEPLLRQLGFMLTPVADAHLCCGAAGTYTLLQRKLSQELLARKLTALQAGGAECIVTANIGCLTHLQTRARIPVRHWMELVDATLDG